MNITEIATIIGAVFGGIISSGVGGYAILKKQGFFTNKSEDFLMKAYQTGKKETSDLVDEIKKQMIRYEYNQEVAVKSLQSIEGHLEKLNSKVVDNSTRLTVLETKQQYAK